MMKKKKTMLLILSVFILLGVGVNWLMNSEFMRIDSCLDLGGAWDYEHKMCSSECEENGWEWSSAKKVCLNPKN